MVDAGWLVEEGGNYIETQPLIDAIKEEKARLNASTNNHEWKTFAAIARRLPSKAAEYTEQPAPRRSKRKALAAAVEVPIGASNKPDGVKGGGATITVNSEKDNKKRRVRYSDPGVTGPSSTSSRRRISSATQSGQPSSRRKSTGHVRANRRHTITLPPQQPPRMREIAQGIPREIQFIPLRQVLSARTKRALRRNQLSDEMNGIDEERRVLQRKNREELARVRAELERGRQLIEELHRQLYAARIAPPSETGSVGHGSVGMAPIFEDDAEETFSPPVFGSSSTPRTPFRFNAGIALTPAIRRFQNENQREPGETPISRRDKKIRSLEDQIEQLREDILAREEEERRRAEEEEIYREAEGQILMEAMDTSQVGMSMADLQGDETLKTSRIRTKVSFTDDEPDEEFAPMLPFDNDNDDDDNDDGYNAAQDFSAPNVSSPPPTEITRESITDAATSVTPELERENETLKISIETMKQRVGDLEGALEDARYRQEGRTSGVQTDSIVDTEKVKLKEMIEMLEDRADVLEQSSLEERNRLWQKIRGHISVAHNYEGVEELDMAIDEILTNLALAQNTADEHHKAFEVAERDLKVERILADEKVAEIAELIAERDSLLVEVEKLETIKSEMDGQMADYEADEERLEQELEDQKKALAVEREELGLKSSELEAAIAEANKLERDLTQLGDVLDAEIAEFSTAPQGPLTTILEKLQAYAEVVKEERDRQQAKVNELSGTIALGEDSLELLRDKLDLLANRYDRLEDISEKQQALLLEKEQEIEGLKQELESFKEQLEETRKTNGMLNDVISSKNEKITSLTDQLTWLTTDLTKIKQKKEEAQNRVVELSAELDNQIEEAKTRGVKLDLDLSGKNQMVSSLEAQLASVSEQLSNLEASQSAKELKILDLTNELIRSREETESQLEQLNIELDSKTGKIVELRDSMDALSVEFSQSAATIEQLNKEQRAKEVEIQELSNLVEKKQEEIANLQTLPRVIELKDRKMEEMNLQISDLGAQIIDKNGLIRKTETGLTALRAEADMKIEHILTLEKDIISLTEECSHLHQELESARRNERELSDTLADKDKKVDELSNEIININSTIAEKSHEVDDLKARVSSLNDTITWREEEIAELQGEIEHLNNKLRENETHISRLEQEISDTNHANDRSMTELRSITDTLSINLIEREVTIATLNRDISDRSGVIEANSGTIKSLTGKIDGLSKLVDSRGETIATLNVEIAHLNKQITSLNADLSLIEGQRASADYKVQEMLERFAEKDERIAELEKLYDNIGVKNTEIDALNDTIDELRYQLDDLGKKYPAAEARIEELLEEVSRKQKTIYQLEADLDSSIIREMEANQRYTDAITVQDSLRVELQQMQSVVDELRAAADVHNQEKEEELSILQQKYTNLEASLQESHSDQLAKLRSQLEQERDEAISSIELKLQDVLQNNTELETELESTRFEFTEIIDSLNSKIEDLEHGLQNSTAETEQTVAELKTLEKAKDAIIVGLEEKIRAVVQAKEESEAAFVGQVEEKSMALAEKEKELANIELAAQNDKDDMRVELKKQHEKISDLEANITELNGQLTESWESENLLEEEIQDYEQSVQLLKDEAAKVKTTLETTNVELSRDMDELRVELLRARDELRQEIEAHAATVEDKDISIANMNELIENYKAESSVLEKRISVLDVDNQKWRQKYNRAIEDSIAQFDAFGNDLLKLDAVRKSRKAKFLERSNTRLLTQEEAEGDGEELLQIEGTHEDASTAGGLMSPDATTNVSFVSPPTPESTHHFAPQFMGLTQAGKKRRFDSGIGVEEDEVDTRFEEYGINRRGFISEGH